jgi:hypothetical protein
MFNTNWGNISDLSNHSTRMHYPNSKPTSLCSLSLMLHSTEATNTNFIVFALTRLGLQPTIYYTGDGHANHYTTDAVLSGIYVLCKGVA